MVKKNSSMGRQKIEIKKLEKEESRFVCFSKRKEGILSKASELSTLCGVQVVVLMESPKGSPYTFGSPGVSQVADRFLSGDQAPAAGSSVHEIHRQSIIQQLNQQYMDAGVQLRAAKKKRAELVSSLKALVQANQQVENADNMEKLNLPELLQVRTLLSELKKEIVSELYGRSGGVSISNNGNPYLYLFLMHPNVLLIYVILIDIFYVIKNIFQLISA